MANLSVLKWRNGGSVQQFCPFPVGGVYISASNASPSSLWAGTTWTRIAAGTFLVSSGGATTGDYAVGKTGGAASVTLSVLQIPAHKHSYNGWWSAQYAGGSSSAKACVAYYNDDITPGGQGVEYTGGGGAHENRPPYLSVDMWRRTA